MKPEAELVDAFGTLFNCTEVSYVKSYERPGSTPLPVIDLDPRQQLATSNVYAIGHVTSREYFEGRAALGDFYSRVASAEYPCHGCRMLPTCGGACPKNWREGLKPCPPEKYNIEQRLILQYFLKRYGPVRQMSCQITEVGTELLKAADLDE